MGNKKDEEEYESSEYEEVTDSDASYETDSDEEVEVVMNQKRKSEERGPKKVKEDSPCFNFRIDTTAAKFGTCKCGWAKIDHEGKKENNASKALKNLKSKSGHAQESSSGGGDGPCFNFRVDTTAAKFGMCKCGFHQSEHRQKEANPAREALMSLKTKNSTRFAKPVKNTGSPCNNFVVDPTAKEFGTCHCGFKKIDHGQKEENAASELLRKLKERNQESNQRADQLAAGQPGMDDDAEEDGENDQSKKNKRKSKSRNNNNNNNKSEEQQQKSAPAAKKSCCIVM